jgi:hypothetical protein
MVTRRNVTPLRLRRAADLVLTLVELFGINGADAEAAKACLHVIDTCPSIIAELTNVSIPDHSSSTRKEQIDRWRLTDFSKTVSTLLDGAIRAKLPLGRELGEAIYGAGRCAGATGAVECNTRGELRAPQPCAR